MPRRNENMGMFEKYRNALIFAVEIRPDLMDNFLIENTTIPLLYSVGEYRLDLSVESDMVNACKNESIAQNCVDRLLDASIGNILSVDKMPHLDLKAYKNLLTYLTLNDCLALLRKAFPCSTRSEMPGAPCISPLHGATSQMISDLIILRSLFSLNLGNTRKLALSNIKPSTFNFLKDDPVLYRLHSFHIIKGTFSYYICNNTSINTAKQILCYFDGSRISICVCVYMNIHTKITSKGL